MIPTGIGFGKYASIDVGATSLAKQGPISSVDMPLAPVPNVIVTVTASFQKQDGAVPRLATVVSSSNMSTLHADPKQVSP